MANAIKIWEIRGDALMSVEGEDFAAAHLEAELEKWIVSNPELLGDKVLVISQQRDIPGIGRPDLLCIDERGTFVIVELKRGLSSREAVAQALDYASWMDSESPDLIGEMAEQYLGRPLTEAFQQTFEMELPDLNCHNHKVLLVAARLDASAERIIEYLSEGYGVEINAVFFSYAKLSDGKEVLARTMLVGDEVGSVSRRQKASRPSVDSLLELASERDALPLLQSCRKVGELWREYHGSGYGGSFSYWASTPSGNNRGLFGINVGAKNVPPKGQLDVWIPVKNLAAITGLI